MCTIIFEEVICRARQTRTKFCLVLSPTGDGSGSLKSVYRRGDNPFGWISPFNRPVDLNESNPPVSILIGLRGKSWPALHGHDVCTFVLELTHNCASTTYKLRSNPSTPQSAFDLFVTVTVSGLVNSDLPLTGREATAESANRSSDSFTNNGTAHSTPPSDTARAAPEMTIPPPTPRGSDSISKSTLLASPPESSTANIWPVVASSSSHSALVPDGVIPTPHPRTSPPVIPSLMYSDEPALRLPTAAHVVSEEVSSEQLTSEASISLHSRREPKLEVPDVSAQQVPVRLGVSRLDAIAEVINAASDIYLLVRSTRNLLKTAYTLVEPIHHAVEIDALILALENNCAFAELVVTTCELTIDTASIVGNILREVMNSATLIKEYCIIHKSAPLVSKFSGSSLAFQVDASLEILNAFGRELGSFPAANLQGDVRNLASSLTREVRWLNRKNDRFRDFETTEGGSLDWHLLGVATHSIAAFSEDKRLLADMPFAPKADRALRSDERGCLPHTRMKVIEAIINWTIGARSDPELGVRALDSDSRVLWLCGVAGSGKSSIAITVAKALLTMGRLAALYGFEAAFQTSLNDTNLFSTIALQRAQRRPAQRRDLLQHLGAIDPDHRSSTDPVEQFRSLLVTAPMERSTHFDDVVVIDAFDELGNTSKRRNPLIALAPEGRSAVFPNGVRFIVTSRYDHDVAQRLESVLNSDQPMVSILRMEDIKLQDAERDVMLYVFHKLRGIDGFEIAQAAGDISRLAVAAEGSFQWASMVCSYILQDDDDNSRTHIMRLREVLATGVGLDVLYLAILNQHYKPSITPPSKTRPLRIILGSLVCALEPLSIRTITSFATAGIPNSLMTSYLPIARRLSSLVIGTQDEVTPLVPFHTSFTDFLRDPERSGEYAIVAQDVHAMLGLACLTVMKQSLRFNICHLETSFLRNDDVPDLAEKIKKYISEELSYACRFWPVHVAAALSAPSGDTGALRELLSELLKNKLCILEWLEVMSVTGTNAFHALSPLSFLQSENADLRDLITFTTCFAVPLDACAPHIYLSALSFTPFSSMISPVRSQFLHLVQVSKPLTSWPRIRHKLEHSSVVRCVVFSPDGRSLVSGDEGNNREDGGGGSGLWDPYSGSALLPRISTASAVLSASFSPDGGSLVSGHKDGTVQIWDARTMTVRGESLKGHTDWVRSVALSFDGTFLASGSSDGTIRFWDPHSQFAVSEPLLGHEGHVLSVAFSPDGTLLASGSRDCSVRLWDVRTLSAAGEPLSGHSDCVKSVAFSLDGKLLASASNDKTIRLWDVYNRCTVGGPLIGHEGCVRSLAFSPNGDTLASCSDDKTVRLWNVPTHSPVCEPLTGHLGKVICVAFSPDGALLASGSYDKSIHVWDTRVLTADRKIRASQFRIRDVATMSREGELLATGSADNTIQLWDVRSASTARDPLVGHSANISCVTFAANTMHMASGSSDGTIRLWDAPTGAAARESLEGHSGRVSSVVFSPDGKLLASGSDDRTIRLWNVDTHSAVERPLTAHSGSISSLAFSPNGALLASASDDNTVRLWDVGSSSTTGDPLRGHSSSVRNVAFSPDGTLLASVSTDSTIRLWDVDTRLSIGRLLDNASSSPFLVFSPDGTLLVSCSEDHAIRVWDVNTQTAVGEPLMGHTSDVLSVAFSEGGGLLTSASADGTVRTWDFAAFLSASAKGGRGDLQIALDATQRNAALLPDLPEISPLSPNSLVQLQDGWVLGSNKELILWIPPALRLSLSNIYEIARIGDPPLVKLDFSNFVCGSDWTKCYSPPVPSSGDT